MNSDSTLLKILEQKLVMFTDKDGSRKEFIDSVIGEYFCHLRKQQFVIPHRFAADLTEELTEQVNAMLLKKIYGFNTIGEYKKSSQKK